MPAFESLAFGIKTISGHKASKWVLDKYDNDNLLITDYLIMHIGPTELNDT